jgi:glycosyltransferase involved in cell wall biosynthesis
MQISIEVPVFKGRFLRPCIESILAQTSEAWMLTLLWDGGDVQSRGILEQLQREGHPRICIHFAENQGIAGARRFLSEHGKGDYILPLDDDDILPREAVERFLQVAAEHPWASLIRGRRVFIDTEGADVELEPWFPFGPRTYDRGMVTDVFNQAQPYLIRRSAYDRTRGWTGFADFMGAGEDCDIFLQLEEVAHFEFIDEVLYRYRLHGGRASHALTSAAAFEMWRRLSDGVIARLGLPLRRISAAPPFVYERLPRPAATLEDVDFVIGGAGGTASASLRQCGVSEDAIHQTQGAADAATWRMAGFRTTARRLVCFLSEDIETQSRSALQTFVEALDSADADLLVPQLRGEEFILVRREVIVATGGFDEHYVPACLQTADFCLQARRRGFSCTDIPLEGVIDRGPLTAKWTDADMSALRSKWRSYAGLLGELPQ